MRVFAEVKTVGICQAGHYFNKGDTVELLSLEPDNGLYYPATRVTDGCLQHLRKSDFDVMTECIIDG